MEEKERQTGGSSRWARAARLVSDPLLSAFAAWCFGVVTGVFVGESYRNWSAPPTLGPAVALPVTTPTVRLVPPPTPTPDEWAFRMQLVFNRTCPTFTVEEVRVREKEGARTVLITLRASNDNADRECVLPRDGFILRDGDGHTYRHAQGDLAIAALGAKRAQFTYSLPAGLDLVQLVTPGPEGRPRPVELELQRSRAHSFGPAAR